jgi:DNA-binding response OmpR family regulator
MTEPYDFGHFSVRLDQRLVLVDGQPATLGSRAFDVLRVLLEGRERVVSKDELMQRVWPGVIVEENNLTVQVATLRKLLGARAITTVAGRGYQFTPPAAQAPVSHGPRPADLAAPQTRHGSATTAPALPRHEARGHLLVAEDNRVNRLLLVRSLELLGHRVVAVDDGRKAFDALHAQRFDLLLLDLGLPGMNGFEVLEAMARDPELREIPVVVTSAVEAVDQVARCIELGADDYLHKPVDATLLKARVASSLEKARLREQQRELIQRLMVAAAGPGRHEATAAPPAASTTATVLAVKLRDAAGVAGELPAADLIGWLDECHTLWRDAVANHGGVVLGDSGGTLLALFGVASGQTVAPTMAQARLSATRAALDMAEMQDLFNAERAAAGRAGAALAVGIASGEVKVGPGRTAEPARWVCVGLPVDAAQSLAWQAGEAKGDAPDSHRLWIDAATQAALRGRVAADPLSPPQALAERTPQRFGDAAIYALRVS